MQLGETTGPVHRYAFGDVLFVGGAKVILEALAEALRRYRTDRESLAKDCYGVV